MATFNVFEHLIEPIGESLQADTRFSGINIFYDRTREREVPRDLTPAINYFLEAPWNDIARGSGAYSLRSRMFKVKLGFGIWVHDARDAASMDRRLFEISDNLFDFFRDNADFDSSRGIYVDVDEAIAFDVDYSGDDGGYMGTQKLTVGFKFISGPGK